MKKQEDLISIIIPVYNVEKYLAECLDSVLSQTYQNLEVIIVNDGSTDSSVSIAEKYALDNTNFIILNKDNGGLSSARNLGLEHVHGKYLMFLDSDDYITNDAVELLYNNLINTNSDISCCRDIEDLKYLGGDNKVSVYEKSEAIDKYLLGIYYEIVCAKLFKKEIFDDIRFPVSKIHEDTFITYKTLDKVERVCMSKYGGYYYRPRSNSLSKALYSDRNYDKIEACKIILNHYKETDHEYLAYNKYLSALLYYIVKTNRRNVSKNIDAKEELSALLKKNGYKDVKLKLLPFMVMYRLGLLNNYAVK